MPPARDAVNHVCRWLVGAELRRLADRELLARFTAGRDGDAFAVLLERHGPLVRGACRRRHLADEHLADEVFQATFLLLSLKAGSLRRAESVGSWLFGVAVRLARKTHQRQISQLRRERFATAGRPEAIPADPPALPLFQHTSSLRRFTFSALVVRPGGKN